MRYLRYFLFAVLALALVLAAVAAYIAATFDPNAYKPKIIRLVKEKKQRTLKLDGDIKLAFWPSLGADLGKLSLSEFKSDKEFAAVESVRVSLALIPLLSRQLVVNEVVIKGVRANIVRFRDGRMNIDDLLAKDDQKQAQFKFDIDHVAIENSALKYRDEAKGEEYDLSGFNLKTGRIANGVPTKVRLSMAIKGNRPSFNLDADLKTQLTFDLGQQQYALEDLVLEAKGQIAAINNLAAKVSGNASARLKTGEFGASKLSIVLTGVSGKDNFDVKLDAPKLAFTADKASGDKVTVVAKIINPQGTTGVSLSLPGIEGTAQAFKSGAMTLDLDMKQGDLTVKSKLSSPVSGNLRTQQVSLPRLIARISASGPNLPGKNLRGELAGSASVDAAKQHAQASLSGKVADSNIKAKLGVAGFSPPGFDFDIDIDQLDIDRYMPPAASGKSAVGQKQPEQPFDLSALKNLRANGTLRIGALKASGVKAANVRLDIKAEGGRVDVSPLSANLYQGTLNGALGINATPAIPAFAVRQKLSGVSIGPLLKDLADKDMLEGRGDVAVDVTAQGNTVTALKKALNGSAAVRLADGALKGINIASTIRDAKARVGSFRGEQTQQAQATEKTDFSELMATFSIKNGIAHNSDLSIKSPLLRISGAGNINIGEDSLDYRVKAAIVGSLKGQGGQGLGDLKGVTVPVHLSGPLATPTYKLDFGGMVADTAKQKAGQVVKDKFEEKLQGGLKGLFGR